MNATIKGFSVEDTAAILKPDQLTAVSRESSAATSFEDSSGRT
jgi:hypothetical protein